MTNQEPFDNVNRPKHYQLANGLEVIDVKDILLEKIAKSQALSHKETVYWDRCWEYLTRFMDKNGDEDLAKAKFYLDRLIQTRSEGEPTHGND